MAGKQFFSKHSKSSAALISLAIHGVFLVAALSFVAVTVIQKESHQFDSRKVNRPRMLLKKLQVPVQLKKRKQIKPKLRKLIVVSPNMKRSMTDIKMPEFSGIKGGMGSAGGAGLGGAIGVGFSIPEVNLFGVRGKGEKVFLILDASAEMMYDEMGGIAAYTIIKNEMTRIIGELGSTALFNVCVYDAGKTHLFSQSMVSASDANVRKVREWIEPLNTVKKGMGTSDYGTKTLGIGGVKVEDVVLGGDFAEYSEKAPSSFYKALMSAMLHRADMVFVLTSRWVPGGYFTESAADAARKKEWEKSVAGKKWKECYRKGLKLLDEENKRRAERGDPPKIIQRHDWVINREYFPNIEGPPRSSYIGYTPEQYGKAFRGVRASKSSGLGMDLTKSGISSRKKKGKADYSVNVIRFTKKDNKSGDSSTRELQELARLSNGVYKEVCGLDGVKSSVSSSEE